MLLAEQSRGSQAPGAEEVSAVAGGLSWGASLASHHVSHGASQLCAPIQAPR